MIFRILITTLVVMSVGCGKYAAQSKKEWDRDAAMFEMLEGADLSVPYNVEYSIVWSEPIDKEKIRVFADAHGFTWRVDNLDTGTLYTATLVTNMMITEKSIRPVSLLVKSFARGNGWDYDAWSITYVTKGFQRSVAPLPRARGGHSDGEH